MAEGSSPEAVLVVYIQNYYTEMLVQERPLVLLCPGGGYNHLSVREAESEALQFLAMGYHAAVLKYSVAPAKFPTQLCELAWAMKYLRSKASEWHIVSDKIVVQGSSAGGHLAASLGVFLFFATPKYQKMQNAFPKVAAGNSSFLHVSPA